MAFYNSTIVKEQPKKKSGFILKFFLYILIFLIAGGAYALSRADVQQKIALYRCYVDDAIATKQNSTEKSVTPFTISTGEDSLAIGKKLEEKKLVSSAYDFVCYVKKIDAGAKIQAGYYEITSPISLEQLVPYLQNSRIPTVRVTIQEGLRMDEIAEKIDIAMGKENSIKQYDKAEFMSLMTNREFLDSFVITKGKTSFEGFMYPDTYEIEKNANARKVAELLLNTFTKKVIDTTTLLKSTELTPYEVVVLASIIEKEAGKSYTEKQTVAGILLKRLKSGWLLNVDAAFLYEKKNWKAPIYKTDIATDTPYNTYIRAGLPPTPISNPGVESIQAVLSPIQSDYWYYLHGTDGQIRYAKNEAEHQKNITLYLR